MIRNVKQYIQNCHICKRLKTTKNKYHELLNSLLMLDKSWIDIIFDFVINLFNNRNYNAVLMMIDRLNKIHHYIFYMIDENKIAIKKTIKLFIQHVWKLHELFITMILNKEFQFISFVYVGSSQLVTRNVVTVNYVDAWVKWWMIFIKCYLEILYRHFLKHLHMLKSRSHAR
jgi:hypothetical protein